MPQLYGIKEVGFMANGYGQADAATIKKYLRGIEFPCSKDELIQKAQEEGAEDAVIEALSEMPDEIFESPADIVQSIGKIT